MIEKLPNGQEIIDILLESKTLDEFSEKYLELNDYQNDPILTEDGAIDASATIEQKMSTILAKYQLAKMIWVCRPKYIRIEKIKRILG